jgi:hypothetical protein
VPDYQVTIEAQGYGDAEDDGEAFLAAVEGLGMEPTPVCGIDDEKGMLMVTFELGAADAREAHDEALDVWSGVWEEAFPDMAPPQTLAIRAVVA